MSVAIDRIQTALRAEGLRGWLMYDFRGSNPVALRILGIKSSGLMTRRFFYWIPTEGEPLRVQSTVEARHFSHLPGRQLLYRGWRDLEFLLQSELPMGESVAVEYSPRGALPTVSCIDAGTMEWLRALGVRPVSSADLIQRVEVPWDDAALASHRRASGILTDILSRTLDSVRDEIAAGHPVIDTELQAAMASSLSQAGLLADHPCIVAFGDDTGNPHFIPRAEAPRQLQGGEMVLLDIWGREPADDAVYADYTWMAFAGNELPPEEERVWRAVRQARDAVIDSLREAIAARKEPTGRSADRIARESIAAAGFERAFLHRTGHNIGHEDHGSGVNLDDLETQDERRIMNRIAFSVEPGIYLKKFGVRSEVNAVSWDGELIVTGNLQEAPLMLGWTDPRGEPGQ